MICTKLAMLDIQLILTTDLKLTTQIKVQSSQEANCGNLFILENLRAKS
jgi:hypothetical protein